MLTSAQDIHIPETSSTMASFLEDYEPEKPKRGQVLEGIILQIEDDTILLDIGAKRDAIVPRQEYTRISDQKLDELAVGQEVPVFIMRTPRGDEQLLVSIKRGEQFEDWKTAQKQLEEEDVLELKVTGYNRGGLEIKYYHLQGFIPNSLISRSHRRISNEKMEDFKRSKVGSTVTAKIIEVNRQKRRLILSCIAAEEETRRKKLESLNVGDVVTGTVVNLVDFGVFVDVGGVDGLVHISEISWEHVTDPSDHLSVGDEVEVLVEGVDIERERISLSRKALLPSPWEGVAERYDIGDIVKGEVTNVRHFGAFVRLSDGIEALIHESEIGIIGDAQPGDVLQTGDPVTVRILDIEPVRERMKLSLRQVPADARVTVDESGNAPDDAADGDDGVINDLAELGAAINASQLQPS